MFQASGLNNYALETLELSASFRYEWSAELKEIYLNNCLVNMSGKVGGWMEVDRFQEHVVRIISQRWNPNGNDSSARYLREVISTNALCTRQVKEQVRLLATGKAMRRSRKDQRERADVAIITKEIVSNNVFTTKEGRSEGCGRKYIRCKDLLSEGTQKMLKGALLEEWKFRTGLRRGKPYPKIRKRKRGEDDEEQDEGDVVEEEAEDLDDMFEINDMFGDEDES